MAFTIPLKSPKAFVSGTQTNSKFYLFQIGCRRAINWFELLKANDKITANACVCRRENQMILEILNDLSANTLITVVDYGQLSLKENSLTSGNM